MKSVIICIATVALLVSCATTIKFPVSNVAPAATITVKKQKDKNDNFIITVTANNLASAERLSPPKKKYIVWIKTKEDGLKNVGQLANRNAQKSTLKTLSAFEPVEIFITAEEKGNVTYPTGIEITRTKF